MGLGFIHENPGLPRRTANRTCQISKAVRSPVVVPLQQPKPGGLGAYRQSRTPIILADRTAFFKPRCFQELNREATLGLPFSGLAWVLTAGRLWGAFMGTVWPFATN